LHIIRKLLRDRGLWSVSYATAYHESSYTRATDVQLEPIRAEIANFLDESGGSMATCEDYAIALGNINDTLLAMLAKDCCGGIVPGSGGGGSSAAGPSTFEDDGSTTYPDEFADRAAYEAYKCHSANALRERIANDASWLETASLTTLTASALAIALITPIPGDELIAMAGYGVALATQGILASSAGEIKTALNGAAGDQFICDFYDAANSSDAQTALGDWGDANLGAVANALYGFFVGADATNTGFGQDAITDNYSVQSPQSCNCAASTWQVDVGTGTTRTDGVEFTINSVPVGANHDLVISAVDGQCDTNDCCEIVTWDPPGGVGQGWLGANWYGWDQGNCPNHTILLQSTVPLQNTNTMSKFATTRSIPFSMTFIVNPLPCPP